MQKRRLFFSSAVLLLTLLSIEGDVAGNENSHAEKRRRMVDEQLRGRDIHDPRVLEAMSVVPRHLFVPSLYRDHSYKDQPLPIAEGQTISQPYIVAFMTQALNIRAGEKVLEVGTGSGYQAAVLAHLTGAVYSIEINQKLAALARRTLDELGYGGVHLKTGDGYRGWEEHAPFDAVIITCAAERIPPPLLQQLGEGGRMILPLKHGAFSEKLTLITKRNGKTESLVLMDVRFVPMTGEVKIKKDGTPPLGD
ncbi:MAG: protein-L-isoaspartate(D-aspartate) O-methyltransferase [Acidobacteria bacterium]|nr:protein-L-isoaspartate(D-aspartate) O-methyltransferase [Acidobacteriota bacterium]MCG2815730.1 protein-L-isoaspartate(D-aspartate) O-methyltransferase [Candidatus Aminicenantes bacterium]MBU1337468.1 protein-L-isoaspartate(D-aspartate) O-methyltransferase [Acidobacteriota bacterium]MBU1474444.1 protein-L-isoaspartate(D-aspartate) O-methyltransferase [Acidobacteriota bacterium]MBU2437526.1 protein-L-isoaspartate(D-aspartate) O-methyltransferase [Acidobacteriota bacterium]